MLTLSYKSNIIGVIGVCFWVIGSMAWFGCLGDPIPEPDPAGDNDEQSGGDDDGTDFDYEPIPPEIDLIYWSAPYFSTGMVTVVGLTDAAVDAMRVIVRKQNGVEVTLPVATDGSFAGRIQAQPQEVLQVYAQDYEDDLSEPVSFAVGLPEIAPIVDGIVGTGQILPPDTSQLVTIEGNGSALVTGELVIGANIMRSTSAAAFVIDSTVSLQVHGTTGDMIDLFLVRPNQHAGYTDQQIVSVP